MALAVTVISLAASFPSLGEEPGWALKEDGWHYYLEDGSPAVGWVEKEGKSYFQSPDGSILKDTVTPDGYYAGPDGAWYERKETILDTAFTAPYKVPDPGTQWNGTDALAEVKARVGQSFSGKRSLRIGDNAVEFVRREAQTEAVKTDTAASRISAGSGRSVSGTDASVAETVLLGLYREPGQGRYRLDIRVALDGERAGAQGATWNYEIFRAMVYQISSAPELLAGALYSTWEEENIWRIGREQWVRVGDCQVLYTSGDGVGRFYIRPVREGNG